MTILEASISKGDKIDAKVLQAINASYKHEQVPKTNVYGRIGGGGSADVTGYFWLRNQVKFVNYAAWDSTYTYSEKMVCSVVTGVYPNQTVKYYKSLQDSNLNKAPATETTWWEDVTDGTAYGKAFDLFGYTSVTFPGVYNVYGQVFNDSGLNSGSGDYNDAWFWRVENPGNTPEVLTLLNEYHSNSPFSLTYEPGYYKYRMRIGAQGASSDSSMLLNIYPGDTNIWGGEQVRVFDSNREALLPFGSREITAKLANEGKLSSVNYLGGDSA